MPFILLTPQKHPRWVTRYRWGNRQAARVAPIAYR